MISLWQFTGNFPEKSVCVKGLNESHGNMKKTYIELHINYVIGLVVPSVYIQYIYIRGGHRLIFLI